MVDASVLQQLKDIHVPDTVSPWPFAPGWWLLILLSLTLLALTHYLMKYFDNFLIRRQFLKEIKQIEKQYRSDKKANYALQKIARTLKRAALYYYPRQAVAGLYGEAWLDFLKATSQNLKITDCERLFKYALYQSSYKDDISEGFILAYQWINQQRPK